ncbi:MULTISPECIES: fasciclin domain-containing protein [unclassified Meiothermus]|uniref:fasciclin domain-containing protein n=1 Tax=unclassified Meiothermus TaxID=370471 RepID=UPI000D7BB37E|nr:MULTISPECIES: fasciclin domain-containing protein [unclassified Meiothermus]PZA08747.1 fasciclin domain-containing protein [Meiothermus sp. Pnk-1]RYM40632.1 fasciclin domain-containing protein [Meiothermus sp. PNK-Is4]
MKIKALFVAGGLALAALGLTVAQNMQNTPDTSKQTIAQIVASNPNFSTLLAAVKAAGLVETLSGPGPFTVFAPTNEAFAKIPKADLDKLLADKAALTKVLTYHVVAGRVPSSEVVKLKEAKTVQGQAITIAVSGGSVILNGYSKVTAVDIPASNGVIHVIDTVLLPK